MSDNRGLPVNDVAMAAVLRTLFLASVCVALTCATSCSRSSESVTPAVPMDIAPGVGVGPVRFGMTVDEVKQALGEPDRTRGKALEYLSLGLAVILSKQDGSVGAIMMGDGNGSYLVDRFKGVTKEGIRMKSARQEIIAAYGEPENATSEAPGLETLSYDSGRTEYSLKDGRLVHIAMRPLRR